MFILHGLFGSSDNWVSFGKQLTDHYQIIIPDMRNHGRSPHSDHWEYAFMADDINKLANKLEFETITILGHSMGGKTGITFAEKFPEKLEKLIVADIAPRKYAIRHRTILEGLISIDLKDLDSRNDADDQLIPYIPEMSLRQFLLKNLDRDKHGFKWKLNLKIINDHLENVGLATYPEKVIDTPTLFIRGINSDYISDDDIMEIREYFSDVRTESIGNAGHWLHAEQPKAFYATVKEFLGI